MSGFLIIAHTPLASALKLAAQHAFPDACGCVLALDVLPNLPVEETEAQARVLLAQAQALSVRGEALILTDVFGATPSNVAQRLADGVHVKVLTGANVPMLWRVLNYCNEPLDALVTRALAGATQGVMQIASSRPQNQAAQRNHDQDHSQHQQ
ncbi:PTS sugar transporter subunit IIA [Aquabacterium sp.]|uniref:PTS sugar transporter subunit IIA n=1 Tax=Aquabacterium sp. TaxID=1872578 RepID=UPI0035AE607C